MITGQDQVRSDAVGRLEEVLPLCEQDLRGDRIRTERRNHRDRRRALRSIGISRPRSDRPVHGRGLLLEEARKFRVLHLNQHVQAVAEPAEGLDRRDYLRVDERITGDRDDPVCFQDAGCEQRFFLGRIADQPPLMMSEPSLHAGRVAIRVDQHDVMLL